MAAFDVALEELHNDSTTRRPARLDTGLAITQVGFTPTKARSIAKPLLSPVFLSFPDFLLAAPENEILANSSGNDKTLIQRGSSVTKPRPDSVILSN